jgi:CBF1 interacting corepressor
MVAGLKFLSKKGFNPQNLTNQKKVFEREQQEKKEERRIKERQDQLQRERDDEELAIARGEVPRLGFLYAAPPGAAVVTANSNNKEEPLLGSTAAAATLTERQPGDDDAAAAFRALFAQSDTTVQADAAGQSQEEPSCFGTILQGSILDSDRPVNKNMSALEKAVGRKKDTGHALTLDEQIQRFPALANAPRAQGISSSDCGVNFKPLGSQIRNVKCMACGIWGHSRGDRECKKSGWNPFEKPAVFVPQEADRKRSRSMSSSSSSSSSSESSEEDRKRRRRHKSSSKKHRRKHHKSSKKDRKHHHRRSRERSESPPLNDESRQRGKDGADRSIESANRSESRSNKRSSSDRHDRKPQGEKKRDRSTSRERSSGKDKSR